MMDDAPELDGAFQVTSTWPFWGVNRTFEGAVIPETPGEMLYNAV
jgi:hypothetical protein